MTLLGRTKLEFDQYRDFGRCPTDFTYAVLTNNLMDAFGRADEANLKDLADIVAYIKETMPVGAWGSPEKVAGWLMHQGLKGWETKVA
jgi:hypothetical protein